MDKFYWSVFAVLLSFLSFTGAQCQIEDKEQILFFNLKAHYGSMIIHSRALHDIGNANPFGVEISLTQQSVGLKAWESCNCYPRRGITIGLWNFDKPLILGNGFASSVFIEPVFGGWNKWYFSVKGAVGIAWLTKPYHPETNPYNFSYSTNIAFPLNLGATLNYKVSDHTRANITLIYNHISNGGLKEPNKGINWPTFALGFDYLPIPMNLNKQNRTELILDKSSRQSVSVEFFMTFKQLDHEQLTKYFIGGINGTYDYRIGRINALSFGAQFEWDGSDRKEISQSDELHTDHKKISLNGGHSFLLGKFHFDQRIGVYIYDQYKANDPVYQQYELTYALTRQLSTGLILKAHRQVADYLSFALKLKLI
jgi:hypothetical protein